MSPKTKNIPTATSAIVFTSFFFSEMGDKTQLVTISLAARYPSAPLLVLAGTTLGMMIADGIGIFAGVIIHKKLPENALRIISAALFIFFGIVGLWQSLHDTFHFVNRRVFNRCRRRGNCSNYGRILYILQKH